MQTPIRQASPEGRPQSHRGLNGEEKRLREVAELSNQSIHNKTEYYKNLRHLEYSPETHEQIERILSRLAFEKLYRTGVFNSHISRSEASTLPDTVPEERATPEEA